MKLSIPQIAINIAKVSKARVVSFTKRLEKKVSLTFFINGSARVAILESANEPVNVAIVLTIMMIIANIKKI